MPKQHIILGCSAAGGGVMSKLRKLAPDDTIICLTAQSEMPYNTCLLADYLSEGTPPNALWTKSATFFEKNNITLKREHRVTELDAENHMVRCHNGATFSYDSLFIGTGTRARQLPTEKPINHGLFSFQTLYDTTALDLFLRTQNPRTALVIGAGLSGVECADALVERGLNVLIAEYSSHLLPTLINATAGETLVPHLRQTTFITDARIAHITADDTGRATGALLDDGSHIAADLVVVAIGATPNTSFAADANLTLLDQSIIVDAQMKTGHDHIYAGGDAAAVPRRLGSGHQRNGTWPDAVQQGMYAAHSMTGASKEYPGLLAVLSSHFYNTQFVSCGPVVSPPASCTIHEQHGTGWYHLLLIEDNKLQGFTLIDRLTQVGLLRRLVTTQEPIPENLFELLWD